MLPCQGRCRRFESGPPLNMQKLILFLFIGIIVVLAIFFLSKNNVSTKILTDTGKMQTEKKTNKSMMIASSAFKGNKKIPSKYTCDRENVNPPLQFLYVPKDVKSLVLIVDDPDAMAKTWVHWIVYNINPDVSGIEENSIPEGGIEGTTDFGKPGYGGPCPPSGTHRYFFKLYALNIVLDLPGGATKQMVEEKIQNHIIDQAELIGLYSRQS